MKTRYAYIGVGIAIFAFAWSAIFIRFANEAPPLIIAFYRMLIASLFWTPFFFIKNTKQKKHPKLTQKHWKWIILAGLFLCFHFATWITSLTLTTVGSAVFMILLQPLLIATAAHIWLKEHLKKIHFIALALTIMGAILITWGDIQIKKEYLIGDILALIGAALAGGYLFIARLTQTGFVGTKEGLHLFQYLPIVYWVATFGLLVLCILSNNSFFPYSTKTWWALLGTGVVPTIIGHSLFNWAMKHLPALTVNIALVGEPIGSTILAWIFFQEPISFGILLGGPIMIIAVILVVKSPTKSET
ncbi:MAG: DMT family transporter [bacterium]|nr:DMT family transporter [bacterium]